MLANSPNLTCNLVARGPRPVNVMMMVTANVDLQEFAENLSAGIAAADALAVPSYAGLLNDRLQGKSSDNESLHVFMNLNPR